MVPIFEGIYSGIIPAGKMLGIPLDAYTIPTKGGSSGAPIVNEDGKLIGMSIMARVGFENFVISVPHKLLYKIIRDIRKNKRVSI